MDCTLHTPGATMKLSIQDATRLIATVARFQGGLATRLTLLTMEVSNLHLPPPAQFPCEVVLHMADGAWYLEANPSYSNSKILLKLACNNQPLADEFAEMLKGAPFHAFGFESVTPDHSRGDHGFLCYIEGGVQHELVLYNSVLHGRMDG